MKCLWQKKIWVNYPVSMVADRKSDTMCYSSIPSTSSAGGSSRASSLCILRGLGVWASACSLRRQIGSSALSFPPWCSFGGICRLGSSIGSNLGWRFRRRWCQSLRPSLAAFRSSGRTWVVLFPLFDCYWFAFFMKGV